MKLKEKKKEKEEKEKEEKEEKEERFTSVCKAKRLMIPF